MEDLDHFVVGSVAVREKTTLMMMFISNDLSNVVNRVTYQRKILSSSDEFV